MMLNITKDTDCKYVRLSHADITAHDDTYTLELVITDESDNTDTTVAITAADITIPAEGDRYFEYAISNGVYGLSLVKTVGTTKTFTNACLFLDCDVRCNAITTDIETSMLHYSLMLAEDCDCDCEKMKPIYELLLEKVEDNPCTTC